MSFTRDCWNVKKINKNLENPFKKAMVIGQKIERIRKLRGLSQAELGKSLGGISKQAISKIEQRSYIDETITCKIARILNITPEGLKSFDPETVILNMMNPNNQIKVGTSRDNKYLRKETTDLWLFYENLLEGKKKVTL